MVDAIKAHDVYTVGQLNHRGQLLRRSVLGMEPVGPTAGTSPATGEPVRALRMDEIRGLERDFLESARRLRDRRLRRGRDPRRQRLSVPSVLHPAVQSPQRCLRRLASRIACGS